MSDLSARDVLGLDVCQRHELRWKESQAALAVTAPLTGFTYAIACDYGREEGGESDRR